MTFCRETAYGKLFDDYLPNKKFNHLHVNIPMENNDKSVEELENEATQNQENDKKDAADKNESADVDNKTNDADVEENEATVEVKEKKNTADLEKELGEMKDKYLRIFAEFDNYRKRTIKEKQDIIKLASRDVLSALLPVVDDFNRAIKMGETNDKEEKIPEGIVLIYDKLMKSLEQQGVKPMESTGQTFDPDLHEALTKVPAPTDDLKGKVIDTIERGYYLNDKIIRYAKVVVGE